jgi:hypothetical protein
MKNISKLLLIIIISFGVIGGCEGGGLGGLDCLICPPTIKKPKCTGDERRCHGFCFPKAFECPKKNTTDSDVYIKSYSSYNAYNFPDLSLSVHGVAYGPTGFSDLFM